MGIPVGLITKIGKVGGGHVDVAGKAASKILSHGDDVVKAAAKHGDDVVHAAQGAAGAAGKVSGWEKWLGRANTAMDHADTISFAGSMASGLLGGAMQTAHFGEMGMDAWDIYNKFKKDGMNADTVGDVAGLLADGLVTSKLQEWGIPLPIAKLVAEFAQEGVDKLVEQYGPKLGEFFNAKMSDVQKGAAHAVPHKGVTLGAHGPEVEKLQGELQGLGYDIGKDGKDGKFGMGTLGAVRKFQEEHGLKKDGVAGDKTHAVLQTEIDKVAKKTAEAGKAVAGKSSEVHMNDANGKDMVVDPKILAAAKASVTPGGQTKSIVREALGDVNTALMVAGAIPVVGDVGAAIGRGVTGVVEAGLDISDGKSPVKTLAFAATEAGLSLAPGPLGLVGNIALAGGKHVLEGGKDVGSPAAPACQSRDMAKMAAIQAASKHGRS